MAIQTVPPIDTAFIKHIHWKALNADVSWYPLKKTQASRPIELKPLYVYYPKSKRFEAINNSQSVSITPAELKELILSDYFTGAAGDYLLKIDSKIYYKTKPDQRLSSTSNTQASTSAFIKENLRCEKDTGAAVKITWPRAGAENDTSLPRS